MRAHAVVLVASLAEFIQYFEKDHGLRINAPGGPAQLPFGGETVQTQWGPNARSKLGLGGPYPLIY